MTKRKATARYATMDLITGEIFTPSILARPPRPRRRAKSYGRYTNTRSVAGNSMGVISLVCSGFALALVAIS